MKRLILVFLLFFGLISPNFSATFYAYYGSKSVSSVTVSIYKNGTRITYGDTNSSGVVTFNLPTGNYSYRTDTNFSGDITDGSSVTLEHKKVTFTVKDNLGNPISNQRIEIFEDGTEAVSSTYTNSSGMVMYYLKPSQKYAYKTEFSQSAFSLQSDASFSLTRNNISVVAKYSNYPINDTFSIYNFSDRKSAIYSYISSSSTDGEVKFNLTIGKYWIKNEMDIYTEMDISSPNQKIILEYKKIRFISNETDPNVLAEIAVLNGRSTSQKKITDGKGYADFYLLPGIYSYSHRGVSKIFKVSNDTTINLSSHKVVFNLKNAATNAIYANFSFKIGQDMDNLSSYMTNASGSCEVKLNAGNYVFSDGISSYPFTVTNGELTVTPPLFDVTFNLTKNLPNAKIDDLYLYSSNNKYKSISIDSYSDGLKQTLLLGNYYYSCDGTGFSSSHRIPFQLTQNITIEGDWYLFQLNLTDNNNSPISEEEYYILQGNGYANTSFKTNSKGVATTYLTNGYYQLQNMRTFEKTPFEINNQNKSIDIKIPTEQIIRVQYNGQALASGSLSIYKEQRVDFVSIPVSNGIAKTYLQDGNTYFVQLTSSNIVY